MVLLGRPGLARKKKMAAGDHNRKTEGYGEKKVRSVPGGQRTLSHAGASSQNSESRLPAKDLGEKVVK